MGNSSKKGMTIKKFSKVSVIYKREPGKLAVVKPETPETEGVGSLKPQARSTMLVGCPRSNKSALPPILLPTPTGLLKEATSLGEEGAFSKTPDSYASNLSQDPTITALPHHKKHLWGQPCPTKLT